MLIEFRIKNYRSIKGEQSLTMLPASKLQERPVTLQKIEHYKNMATISSAVIYGANNAGKSNILKAFRAFTGLVTQSQTLNVGDSLIANEFFILDNQTKHQPTEFFIDFIATDGLRYQYKVQFDQKKIYTEELWWFPLNESHKLTASKLFVRAAGTKISYGNAFRGHQKSIENELLDNQLFLTAAVQKKNEQLKAVYLFFRQQIHLSTFDKEEYSEIQLRNLAKFVYENKTNPIVALIQDIIGHSDTGIIHFEVVPKSKMPEISFPAHFSEAEKIKIRQNFIEQFYEIKVNYRLFDGEQEIGLEAIPLREQSTGTKKFLHVLNEVLEALSDGNLLIIDELDKSLHSTWTRMIINLFHNPLTNPKKAQLIFSTHDVTLLDSSFYARDQIYFIEKDRFGASQLYALSSFKGIRNNVAFDQLYENGQLGAIPMVRELQIINRVANSEIFYGKAQ
jgi:uncharacterized protein